MHGKVWLAAIGTIYPLLGKFAPAAWGAPRTVAAAKNNKQPEHFVILTANYFDVLMPLCGQP
jgi:hypothetical protein